MNATNHTGATSMLSGAWHFVGDSHIGIFRHASEQNWITRPCQFSMVGGATAVGLRNPNSMTNALDIFRSAVLPVAAHTVPVIQLGEVDCGFVIWYRAQKHNESIEAQTNASITAYFDFVKSLLSIGYKTVVITAATLPTIRENVDWGEVANARREVMASLFQRTQLTLEYNRILAIEARRLSLPFVDITDQILDPITGVLADAYRHPDPTDHHLHPDTAGPLWAAALNRVEHAAFQAHAGRMPEPQCQRDLNTTPR